MLYRSPGREARLKKPIANRFAAAFPPVFSLTLQAARMYSNYILLRLFFQYCGISHKSSAPVTKPGRNWRLFHFPALSHFCAKDMVAMPREAGYNKFNGKRPEKRAEAT